MSRCFPTHITDILSRFIDLRVITAITTLGDRCRLLPVSFYYIGIDIPAYSIKVTICISVSDCGNMDTVTVDLKWTVLDRRPSGKARTCTKTVFTQPIYYCTRTVRVIRLRCPSKCVAVRIRSERREHSGDNQEGCRQRLQLSFDVHLLFLSFMMGEGFGDWASDTLLAENLRDCAPQCIPPASAATPAPRWACRCCASWG